MSCVTVDCNGIRCCLLQHMWYITTMNSTNMEPTGRDVFVFVLIIIFTTVISFAAGFVLEGLTV